MSLCCGIVYFGTFICFMKIPHTWKYNIFLFWLERLEPASSWNLIIISYHIISYIIYHYIILYYIILYYVILYYIILYYIILLLRYIILHHITFIMLCYMIWYDMIWYDISHICIDTLDGIQIIPWLALFRFEDNLPILSPLSLDLKHGARSERHHEVPWEFQDPQ